MKKVLKKIFIAGICWAVVVGFLSYEAYSIIKKEYQRQLEITEQAREKINFGLDMVKIGVLTEDVETYEKNVKGIREQIAVILPLELMRGEQADYLGALNDYVDLLDRKALLLKEMQLAKDKIRVVKEKMNENYGNKDNLSRDKLREAKDKLLELRINTEDFSEGRATIVVKAVNEILEGMADKAAALADCIDACYKNRINEINDELADKIKSFGDVVAEYNLNFEKEFDFSKMLDLREGRVENNDEEMINEELINEEGENNEKAV